MEMTKNVTIKIGQPKHVRTPSAAHGLSIRGDDASSHSVRKTKATDTAKYAQVGRFISSMDIDLCRP